MKKGSSKTRKVSLLYGTFSNEKWDARLQQYGRDFLVLYHRKGESYPCKTYRGNRLECRFQIRMDFTYDQVIYYDYPQPTPAPKEIPDTLKKLFLIREAADKLAQTMKEECDYEDDIIGECNEHSFTYQNVVEYRDFLTSRVRAYLDKEQADYAYLDEKHGTGD